MGLYEGDKTLFAESPHSTHEKTKIHVDTKRLAYIIIRHIQRVHTHQKSRVEASRWGVAHRQSRVQSIPIGVFELFEPCTKQSTAMENFNLLLLQTIMWKRRQRRMVHLINIKKRIRNMLPISCATCTQTQFLLLFSQ